MRKSSRRDNKAKDEEEVVVAEEGEDEEASEGSDGEEQEEEEEEKSTGAKCVAAPPKPSAPKRGQCDVRIFLDKLQDGEEQRGDKTDGRPFVRVWSTFDSGNLQAVRATELPTKSNNHTRERRERERQREGEERASVRLCVYVRLCVRLCVCACGWVGACVERGRMRHRSPRSWKNCCFYRLTAFVLRWLRAVFLEAEISPDVVSKRGQRELRTWLVIPRPSKSRNKEEKAKCWGGAQTCSRICVSVSLSRSLSHTHTHTLSLSRSLSLSLSFLIDGKTGFTSACPT